MKLRNVEIMQFKAAWMELENIIFSEVKRKEQILDDPHICGIENNRMRDCRC